MRIVGHVEADRPGATGEVERLLGVHGEGGDGAVVHPDAIGDGFTSIPLHTVTSFGSTTLRLSRNG